MTPDRSSPPPAPSPVSEWAGLVREHPGLLLTAGYLVLTVVGLSYQLCLFHNFQINILEYVETSDFLLGALRTPLVIALALLPLPMFWYSVRFNEWLHRRFPRYGSWDRSMQGKVYKTASGRIAVWGFLSVVYAFYFLDMYAERVSDRIKAGHGREVRVELASGTPFASRTLLLGTTAKFVIVYVPEARKTHVIPIENLSRMVVSSEKPSG